MASSHHHPLTKWWWDLSVWPDKVVTGFMVGVLVYVLLYGLGYVAPPVVMCDGVGHSHQLAPAPSLLGREPGPDTSPPELALIGPDVVQALVTDRAALTDGEWLTLTELVTGEEQRREARAACPVLPGAPAVAIET